MIVRGLGEDWWSAGPANLVEQPAAASGGSATSSWTVPTNYVEQNAPRVDPWTNQPARTEYVTAPADTAAKPARPQASGSGVWESLSSALPDVMSALFPKKNQPPPPPAPPKKDYAWLWAAIPLTVGGIVVLGGLLTRRK